MAVVQAYKAELVVLRRWVECLREVLGSTPSLGVLRTKRAHSRATFRFQDYRDTHS